MNYLLDTHYLLWAVADSCKIKKRIRDIITDPENRIIVSSISFWEVSLKFALGKLMLKGFGPEDLPQACAEMGFQVETLSAFDSCRYHQLTTQYHKDPFDKMLIWQAMSNGHTFISSDKEMENYESVGLRLLNS